MPSATPPRPTGLHPRDIIAGISVAMVLLPQSVAYAELAGLPGQVGLFAAAVAPIAAALLASSAFLQTGPTAVTALLTFGALSALPTQDTAELVGMAALCALMVGIIRAGLGVARLGTIAYLLSPPVLRGFASGAAVVILASQLPAMLGVQPAEGATAMASAGRALVSPEHWHLPSVAFAAGALAIILLLRRFAPLVPGILLVAAGGVAAGSSGLFDGALLGAMPEGGLTFSLDLPWSRSLDLLVPAAVIAVVGFAEPVAIARQYAAQDRTRWDPDRELAAQGLANIAAGLFQGLPVGGSFSRSALARTVGGRTRWAGAIAGVTVLIALPWADIIATLPRPILSAIIASAVVKLMAPRKLLAIWRHSRPQAGVAWITFTGVLLLAPRIEFAVLMGASLAMALHAWREMRLAIPATRDGDTLVVTPQGVLWFGTAQRLEQAVIELIGDNPDADALFIDLSGLGRIDYAGAIALSNVKRHARDAGLPLTLSEPPPQTRRILGRVCPELLAAAEY